MHWCSSGLRTEYRAAVVGLRFANPTYDYADHPTFDEWQDTGRTGGIRRGGLAQSNRLAAGESEMKVRASVKRMCRNCKIVRRKRVVRVICTDPRHKQRQG